MFGELKQVQVFDQDEYALITFKDFISAFFAQQSLNNYFLSKYNATLVVKWIPRETHQVIETSKSSHPK